LGYQVHQANALVAQIFPVEEAWFQMRVVLLQS